MRRSPTEIDVMHLRRLLQLAREEDLGRAGDITTAVSIADPARISARIVARADGILCGSNIIPCILEVFECNLEFDPGAVDDGGQVKPNTIIGTLHGPVDAVLAVERTMLNFLQRLSGVATLTRRFVDAVARTTATIYDTRKTTPGWRDLEKYAVRCGGGHNHRHGLYDAVLVKDNHLAGVPDERLAHHAFEILNRLHELNAKPDFVEFEVQSLAQLEVVLKVVGIDVIMLDNFAIEQLREAVARRDAAGLRGKIQLEASGGVTLDTVRAIADTGVERISVGALTHSATALDIAVDV